MNEKTRILIVDDHPTFRLGLSQALGLEDDFEVVGEAESTAAAVSMLETFTPDVVLTDISMPGENGIDLIRQLTDRWPNLPVLVLSMHNEVLFAERALRSGARGYLIKQEPPTNIVAGIRKVLTGEIAVSDQLASRLLQWTLQGTASKEDTPNLLASLSNRELEIFQMLGQGHSSSEIAKILQISVKTVDTHRAHIKRKVGANSAHELLRTAVVWALEGNI